MHIISQVNKPANGAYGWWMRNDNIFSTCGSEFLLESQDMVGKFPGNAIVVRICCTYVHPFWAAKIRRRNTRRSLGRIHINLKPVCFSSHSFSEQQLFPVISSCLAVFKHPTPLSFLLPSTQKSPTPDIHLTQKFVFPCGRWSNFQKFRKTLKYLILTVIV